MNKEFDKLISEIKGCKICQNKFGFEPHPVMHKDTPKNRLNPTFFISNFFTITPSPFVPLFYANTQFLSNSRNYPSFFHIIN